LRAEYTPAEAYDITYDKLVIATGCRSASFNTPGVLEHARFLKDVREARAIRRQLLNCFELASKPGVSEEEQKKLLSFRVVGGGPTGVEFAAELHDFVVQDVYRLYPHLKDKVTISLYDTSPGILGGFDASLRGYAERKFARDGVTVNGNSKITAVGRDWIELQDGTKCE
jgi:NADH dehydrogenase